MSSSAAFLFLVFGSFREWAIAVFMKLTFSGVFSVLYIIANKF